MAELREREFTQKMKDFPFNGSSLRPGDLFRFKMCTPSTENGGNDTIWQKIMFDLAFFYRKKLDLEPVVLTQLAQEPPAKGFKAPVVDFRGIKRVTHINAPIFIESAFFAHYEGVLDRRMLDDDDKKKLVSSKDFEAILQHPEKYTPVSSKGAFFIFKEYVRPLNDVFQFIAAQTYCIMEMLQLKSASFCVTNGVDWKLGLAFENDMGHADARMSHPIYSFKFRIDNDLYQFFPLLATWGIIPPSELQEFFTFKR